VTNITDVCDDGHKRGIRWPKSDSVPGHHRYGPPFLCFKVPRCARDFAQHPAWKDFISYCQELQFGELEKLKIQNGVPMMAELATRKVKFGPPG